MNRPVYIYALIDPFTFEIRYVGKSIRPRERLLNQCNEKSNTYRCHWIQSVIRRGVRPLQIILQELGESDDWQSAECWWIATMKRINCPLTNSTEGGDGVAGLSTEAKAKMLKTWTGRKHKPETLIKISEASRKRRHGKETRELMSRIRKGKPHSETWNKRVGDSNKKLTPSQVIEIRALLDRKVSQYAIADMYGVHQGTISNIKRNLFYKEVEGK